MLKKCKIIMNLKLTKKFVYHIRELSFSTLNLLYKCHSSLTLSSNVNEIHIQSFKSFTIQSIHFRLWIELLFEKELWIELYAAAIGDSVGHIWMLCPTDYPHKMGVLLSKFFLLTTKSILIRVLSIAPKKVPDLRYWENLPTSMSGAIRRTFPFNFHRRIEAVKYLVKMQIKQKIR